MTTLDDIAARDAKDAGYGGWTQAQDDRRYLLGLVREARDAITALSAHPRNIDSRTADLLARLTEGSDRT